MGSWDLGSCVTGQESWVGEDPAVLTSAQQVPLLRIVLTGVTRDVWQGEGKSCLGGDMGSQNYVHVCPSPSSAGPPSLAVEAPHKAFPSDVPLVSSEPLKCALCTYQ